MNIKNMVQNTRAKKMNKTMQDMEESFLHHEMKHLPNMDRAKMSRHMLAPEPVKLPSLGKPNAKEI